jgi:hypothetical protein
VVRGFGGIGEEVEDHGGGDDIGVIGGGIVAHHQAGEFAVFDHGEGEAGIAGLERGGEAIDEEGGVIDGVAGDFDVGEGGLGDEEISGGFELPDFEGIADFGGGDFEGFDIGEELGVGGFEDGEIGFVVDDLDGGGDFATAFWGFEFDEVGIADEFGGDEDALVGDHRADGASGVRGAFSPRPGEVPGLVGDIDADDGEDFFWGCVVGLSGEDAEESGGGMEEAFERDWRSHRLVFGGGIGEKQILLEEDIVAFFDALAGVENGGAFEDEGSTVA